MKTKIRLMALLAIIFSTTASAESQIFHQLFWKEYSSNVQSFTDIYVYDTKRVFIHTKFSNGNRTDPQDMMVYIKLLRPNGSWFLQTKHHVHRLRPSLGGKSPEHVVTSETTLEFALPSEISADVEFSRVTPEMSAYAEKLFNDFLKKGQPESSKDKD